MRFIEASSPIAIAILIAACSANGSSTPAGETYADAGVEASAGAGGIGAAGAAGVGGTGVGGTGVGGTAAGGTSGGTGAQAGAGGAATGGGAGAAGTAGTGVAGTGGGGDPTSVCGSGFDGSQAENPSFWACIDQVCCASFSPCWSDAACNDCLHGINASGCMQNPTYVAFVTCVVEEKCPVGICGTDVVISDTEASNCIEASCCDSFVTCVDQPACWDCVKGQGTNCETNAQFQAYTQCAYVDAKCYGEPLCGTTITSDDSTLAACINASCCTAFGACAGQPACLDCLAQPSGCSNSAYAAYEQCLANHCGS